MRIAAVIAGLIALAGAAPALAQPYPGPPPGPRPDSLGEGWREQQDEARDAVRQGRHLPLARVIDELRRRTPGRQLDAGLERGADGRPVYRIRWATQDGRRIDYLVDAGSGAILGTEGR